LLAHVNGRSGWHGMIYFDSARAYGTVSYYLWKLFGLNRPDYTVKTEATFTPSTRPAINGAIGVGTWNTSAEYKDIQVEKDGAVLYRSDFAQNAAAWKPEGGSWSIADGAYRQKEQVVAQSYLGDEKWSNYTLTLKARKISGPEGFLIIFGRRGSDKYWWNIGGWGNREHAIEFNQSSVGRHVPGSIEANRWYDIKVELKERLIRCYLDGKLVHEAEAYDSARFFASAGREESTGDLILKVINTSPESVIADLTTQGIDKISPDAPITVLQSARLDDNNSLAEPLKVAPVTNSIKSAGTHFEHSFPAQSLTILRLKKQN
jgi:alpha-L-arabinofuranosidase